MLFYRPARWCDAVGAHLCLPKCVTLSGLVPSTSLVSRPKRWTIDLGLTLRSKEKVLLERPNWLQSTS